MNASCKQPKKRLAYVGDDSLDEKSPCKTKGFGVQCNYALHCMQQMRAPWTGVFLFVLGAVPRRRHAVPCHPSVETSCSVQCGCGMAWHAAHQRLSRAGAPPASLCGTRSYCAS
jgi:hypothetical protein